MQCALWLLLVLGLVLGAPASATAQGLSTSEVLARSKWQLQFDDKLAPQFSYQGAPLIDSSYVFWGKDWQWAGLRISSDRLSPNETTRFEGTINSLDLALEGRVIRTSENELRYEWNVRADRDLTGAIGGGLEFNLDIGSPVRAALRTSPELIPGGYGWTWPLAQDTAISVRFDQPLENLYFERGRKSKIRALFIGDSLPAGEHNFGMTITLPEDDAYVDLVRLYTPINTSRWLKNALSPTESPVDLRFLNHTPAGKHGFVQAHGDSLVFEDSTPIRFWGTTVAAHAIPVDKRKIETQARRIAMLGYNLVRFHHQDSMEWVQPTVIDQERSDSQHLDPDVMDNLDYWIKCLKDQGVYVWLDLHVGRLFKEGDAIGAGWPEMLGHARKPEKGAEGRGYNYFNTRVEELMRNFNEAFLTHVNPYTGVAYVDEPAIAGVLLTNENDLTHHFGNRMLPDKGNPIHNARFEEAVTRFSREQGLPRQETRKTWLPGPSKIFLADREWRWNQRMIRHLRSLGLKVPIATTQMWGNMPAFGLPALTAGDIIDVHSYGDVEALTKNPRYAGNFIAYAAMGQAVGKPVAISEWNVPYPAEDRFTAPLYMASIATLQGWDAPMLYNYSQRDFDNRWGVRKWSTFQDPALTGMMPAAALLFRQGHVREAEKSYVLQLDKEQLYYRAHLPETMTSLRTLVEQSKIAIGLPDIAELDWDRASPIPGDARVLSNIDVDFVAAKQADVTSDTGELRRFWAQGIQTINTPRSQAVQGWVGGRRIQLSDVTFEVTTPKAAVIVQSLDGNPIAASQRMLVTAVARAKQTKGDELITYSEPVEGQVIFQTHPTSTLYALSNSGSKWKLGVADPSGKITLQLSARPGSHWFLIERISGGD